MQATMHRLAGECDDGHQGGGQAKLLRPACVRTFASAQILGVEVTRSPKKPRTTQSPAPHGPSTTLALVPAQADLTAAASTRAAAAKQQLESITYKPSQTKVSFGSTRSKKKKTSSSLKAQLRTAVTSLYMR